MPCCCHSVNKRIIIVRGDDTDFNDRTLLTLRLSSDVLDLSTFKATLMLFSLVREYDDLTQNLTVNYSAEETMTLPYGNITGVLRLYDTSERVDTIETNIPFQVVSEVEAREIELRDSYYSVEITDGEETILNIAIESAISVRIGQVQTLQPDEPAYVTNMGSNNHLVLNFGIPQGIKGERGEKGDTGENGQDGRDGTDGRSAEMRIGAVETLQPTQSAYVINTGTSLNAVLDFGIPRGEKGEQGERGLQGERGEQGIQGIQGEKGDKGDKGDKGNTGATGEAGQAATVAIGTVTTLQPNQSAYVNNSGTSSAAVFNFGIPKGEKGDTGSQGEQGEKGDTGASGQAATVQVGTVTTLSPSESAYVQNVGTTSQAIFNFGIPKGDTGSATGVSWGTIDGTLSNQTDLQTALNAKQDTISDLSTIRSGASAGATALQPNTAITGATKCKITYDSKGLVTGGADLQASDIPDLSSTYQTKLTSSNKLSTDYISGLSTVATSGSFSDLSGTLNVLQNIGTGDYSLGVLDGYVNAYSACSYGHLAYATGESSLAIGCGNPKGGFPTASGKGAIAIGSAIKQGTDGISPRAVADYCIQIGCGYNNETKTMKVMLGENAGENYTLLESDGTIPMGRLKSGVQTTTNLVTSVSSSSTDSQYASAKCLYDLCGNVTALINAL